MVIPLYADLQIHPALTEEDRQKCLEVRIKVFVNEQKFSLEDEVDEYDALSQHWIATCEASDKKERIPVGTVRLYRVNDQVGKLGRMAVLSEARGMSVGRKLVLALQEAAKTQNIKSIYLEGQVDKRIFYQKVGFVVEKENEEPYVVRGALHYKMWMKSLS